VKTVLLLTLIAIAFFLVLTASVARERRREEKRHWALRDAAKRLGLDFATGDHTVLERYAFLSTCDKAGDAAHVMSGEYGGFRVCAFDYSRIRTGLGKKEQVVSSRLVAERYDPGQHPSRTPSPSLVICPEGLAAKLVQVVHDDIDFDGTATARAFSQAFVVRAENEAFARAVCDEALMDYLLPRPFLCIEVNRHCVALTFRGLRPDLLVAQETAGPGLSIAYILTRAFFGIGGGFFSTRRERELLEPDEIEPALQQLAEVCRRIPEW